MFQEKNHTPKDWKNFRELVGSGELRSLLSIVSDALYRSLSTRFTKRTSSVRMNIGILFLSLYAMGIFLDIILVGQGFRPVPTSFFITNGIVNYIIVIATEAFLQHFIKELRSGYLINQLVSIDDVQQLELSLRNIFNNRNSCIFGFLFSSIIHITFLYVDLLGGGILIRQLGIVYIVVIFISNFFWGTSLYVVVTFMQILGKINKFSVQISSFDPSQSEFVYKTVSLINRRLYLLAIVAALITVAIYIYGLSFVFPPMWILVPLIWGPSIGVFTIGHFSLAQVIIRAKQENLNSLQQQISRLCVVLDTIDKESLEKINQLVILHEKITSTSNTAINPSVVFNFVNSLLLPLPAFILVNWDQLSDLWISLFK